eukprot:5035183-Karenia_brevis.AAC.1
MTCRAINLWLGPARASQRRIFQSVGPPCQSKSGPTRITPKANCTKKVWIGTTLRIMSRAQLPTTNP